MLIWNRYTQQRLCVPPRAAVQTAHTEPIMAKDRSPRENKTKPDRCAPLKAHVLESMPCQVNAMRKRRTRQSTGSPKSPEGMCPWYMRGAGGAIPSVIHPSQPPGADRVRAVWAV